MKEEIIIKQKGRMFFLEEKNDAFISFGFFAGLLSCFNKEYTIINVKTDDYPNYIRTNESNIYTKKLEYPFESKSYDETSLLQSYSADKVFLDGISLEDYRNIEIMSEFERVFIIKQSNIMKEMTVQQLVEKSAMFFEVFPDGAKSIMCYFKDKGCMSFVEKYVNVQNGK